MVSVPLRSASLEATFVPAVGMVCSSLRHRGEELLGRRTGLTAYALAGATMGIPLLHPWANRLSADAYEAAGRVAHVNGEVPRDEHGLAIHGFLPAAWTVTASDPLRARLDVPASAAFPFAHRVGIAAMLDGARLEITTTVTALDMRVPVAFGFHPYLRLPGVPRRAWQLELPAMRRLELDLDGIPTGRACDVPAFSGALGSATFDDGYAELPDGASFVLAGGGRRLVVRFERGFPCAQVYAPADDDVVCFEPMTAPTDALVSGDRLPVLEPGETYEACFSVEVEG